MLNLIKNRATHSKNIYCKGGKAFGLNERSPQICLRLQILLFTFYLNWPKVKDGKKHL